MKYFKKLINLYLYSSLHIGLGALGLTLFSYSIFDINPDRSYLVFVFASTIFLYCIHRYIGIEKLKHIENKGRFKVISEYRLHILVYAIISCLVAIFYFLQFSFTTWTLVLLPSVVSLLYAIPLLGNGKRLRDVSFVKIYLIALTWSWVTVFVPLFESVSWVLIFLLFIERALFIFAITLPFDIRDSKIDAQSNVGTLVHQLGTEKAFRVSLVLLFVLGICQLLIYFLIKSELMMISLLLTYLFTWLVIRSTKGKSHDYYYTGMLDGTMILPYLIYWLLSFVI